MSAKIILIGGRTGGPILPLITISKNLALLRDIQPVIVGIRKGYEEKVAVDENIDIEFLPEAKLRPRPKNFNPVAYLVYSLDTFGTLLILIYSTLVSLIFLAKHKPKVILSAGGFLAVPVIFAASLYNVFTLGRIKIVVHQQDPLPGLANRLTVGLATLKSYVFDFTAQNYPQFAEGLKIPNPISVDNFDSNKMMQTAIEIAETKPAMHLFFRNLPADKPLLLIYGGASGAEKINDWVVENLVMLKSRFSILHLTGTLQQKEYQLMETQGYLSVESLSEKEMRLAQNVCDVCLCRAGLGSISELLYLQKPAYLVPIPDSHQEINADQVSEYFYILNQDNQNEWLSKLFTTYPQFFHDIQYPSIASLDADLKNYYNRISGFLDT